MKIKALLLIFVLGLVFAGCAPKPAREVVLLKESVKVQFTKFPSLSGSVKNVSDKDLQLRSIAFTIWEDASHEMVKDAGVTWFAKNLAPNETATFEIQFPDLKSAEGLAFYSYELRWYDKAASRLISKTANASL